MNKLSLAGRAVIAVILCLWWSGVFWVCLWNYQLIEDAAQNDGSLQTVFEVVPSGLLYLAGVMSLGAIVHYLHDSEAEERYEEHLRNRSASPAAPQSNGQQPTEGHRGSRIISMEDAKSIAKSLWGKVGVFLLWGGVFVAEKIATMHFLVVGATGSGKTLIFRMLMWLALARIKPGSDHRAMVYDGKQDAAQILSEMDLKCPVILANPRDARAWAWSIALDINSIRLAKESARAFIPEEEGQNRFFSDAASDLLAGVFTVFLLTAPGKWGLRDVVLATMSKRKLKALLAQRTETAHLLEYFEEPRALANILSTLKTRMSAFEPVAAAWSRCSSSFSLKEWIEGPESILVLGNDEASRVAIDAINRVLFKLATELVLTQSESNKRRIWFFLDEVREAGKLDGLSRLMTKGRSKGAAVVLGFQDIEGMRAVYGDKVANELIGQCATKALLRSSSPETAEWQSRVIGEREQVEFSESKTEKYAFQTDSKTLSEQVIKRASVLPSEFMTIPPTTVENGLTGYFATPETGWWCGTIDGAAIDRVLKAGVDNAKVEPGFIPRSGDEEVLRPWDLDDVKRLALYGPPTFLGPRDANDEKSVLKIIGQSEELRSPDDSRPRPIGPPESIPPRQIITELWDKQIDAKPRLKVVGKKTSVDKSPNESQRSA